MICICIKWHTNSSHAVVQLAFARQNYTVVEGSSVNITLEAVPPSEGYDLNFTVYLQYMNGSATGKCAYTALTVKNWSSSTLTLHLSGYLSPFPCQQLAMTIHLVHTLWPSLLVKCQPTWHCLPWMTAQQSYQSTWWLWLSPLTNQRLLRLSHPTWHSSLLLMTIQVLHLHAHSAHDSVHVSNGLCMYIQYVHVLCVCYNAFNVFVLI